MAIELLPGMMLSSSGVNVTGKKLSEADVKKVQTDAKTAANTDLLQLSPDSVDPCGGELSQITSSGFESGVAPELFSAVLPQTDADGSYTVGGVQFSASELAQSRSVVSAAAGSLSAGTLDYSDYAKMGLAVSSVEAYAKSSLSAEQGQVLKNAMQEYTSYLISYEQEMLSEDSYVEGNRGELSAYYGVEDVADSTRLNAINALIDEMNRVSGGNKAHVSAGYSTVVQSATNQNLISGITDLFSGLNLSDASAVSGAMETYKTLMTPALLASGTKAERVNEVLDKQIAGFMSQINSAFSEYMKLDARV